MCNANNHPDDCVCGWGGVWYGSTGGGPTLDDDSWLFKSVGDRSRREGRQTGTWSDLSFGLVDFNSTCPVCGAAVYFYESPYGGRVFFDELGPPWPTHPCTDNFDNRSYKQVTEKLKQRNSPHPWQVAGWIALGGVTISRHPGEKCAFRLEGSKHQYRHLDNLYQSGVRVYFMATQMVCATAVRIITHKSVIKAT